MRARRLLASLAVLGLVAAACGDRGEDTSDVGGGDDTDSGAVSGGEGDFGDLEGVCGPNEGGGEVPDAGPEEVLGVTEDSIAVGTVADPGFEARPDLNIEMHDAAEAFVEWCNEAGGINGRQIDLTLRDAKIFEYEPVIEEACREDFAIVGSGAVQDNLWADVGVGCDLIDIAGFSVTPEKAGDAGEARTEVRSVQPVPNAADRFQTSAYVMLDEEFPGASERTAVLYGDLATTRIQKDKVVDGIEQVGFEVVHEASYNVTGEANWAPFAAALRNEDISFLHFVGEGENFALLLQAMEQIDHRPEVMLMETNFYDQEFLAAAGAAAEGVYIRGAYTPFEEADENPATRQYLDLVEAQGGKVAQLGAQGMSAWMLFAQSVKTCDLANDLTRSCVLDEAASVTEWTGGGLHAPSDPSENEPSDCTVILRVEGGEFVRHAPAEGFDCGEDSDRPYVVEVDVEGAS